MSSDKALVSLEVTGGMAVVSLERPPVNAMSRALMEEFKACLLRAERDPSVRVIIVRSKLDGIFSAGADIRELQGLDPEGCASFIELGQRLFARLGEIPKPIVAVINGVCVGGGLELSMACDLRLAGESARFGQPEVNLGLISGWGGTQRLPRLVGKTRASEMLLVGEQISAAQALTIGLVNRVVPDDSLLDEAMALGQKLVAKSPVALAKIKETIERGLSLTLTEGLQVEAGCYVEAYTSEDAKEGVRAFLEKRPARFAGR